MFRHEAQRGTAVSALARGSSARLSRRLRIQRDLGLRVRPQAFVGAGTPARKGGRRAPALAQLADGRGQRQAW
jgi:hypothetical protein